MLERRPLFPGVIEINHQAGWRIGCSVYLLFDENEWILVDIGYEENVDEIVELIRQIDFPISQCLGIIATHADVDHIQGLAKAKSLLKAPAFAHPKAVESLEQGNRIKTFAEISAQNVHLEMPVVKIEKTIVDGDKIKVGNRELEVWHSLVTQTANLHSVLVISFSLVITSTGMDQWERLTRTTAAIFHHLFHLWSELQQVTLNGFYQATDQFSKRMTSYSRKQSID